MVSLCAAHHQNTIINRQTLRLVRSYLLCQFCHRHDVIGMFIQYTFRQYWHLVNWSYINKTGINTVMNLTSLAPLTLQQQTVSVGGLNVGLPLISRLPLMTKITGSLVDP